MEYKTRSIQITVRPDDIVEVTNLENWNEPDTLETAQENIAMMETAMDGKRRAIMVHLPNTYTSKEILEYYYNANVGEIARAFVANSFASKVVGNLYLKLAGKATKPTGVQFKIFSQRTKAIKWLLERIKEDKGNKLA
ncbi:DUF7793 family protein [Aureispira anguillae]|uniref:DUF7793 domain-containing protein n=1 Tax=Aureispira anguillae TaxID=2864201 RepID=A0A915YB21_9BACT|nr:hypothetical protein [Aureispira anguillae]BDS09779.1 hypothetical protein AsAng_0004840 [Aureispira anguillae]